MALFRMVADGSFPKAYLSTPNHSSSVSSLRHQGIGFGIGMGLSRAIEWFSLPIFIVLQAAPMAAIIPLLTYIYGIGLTSKVLAVVVLAAPVIVMNSYKGIRNTNPSLIQMCRAFLGTQTPGSDEDYSSSRRCLDIRRAESWPRHGIYRGRDR